MIVLVCEFYSGDMDATHTHCLPVSSSWGTAWDYADFFHTHSDENIIKSFPHLLHLWPIDVFDLASYDYNQSQSRASLTRVRGWYDETGYHTLNECENCEPDEFTSWEKSE